MKVVIVSPSLDTSQNVSGISSVTQFIINNNPEHEYIHFGIGKMDNEVRNLSWFLRILKTYNKWFLLMVSLKGGLIHFNLALSNRSLIRDFPLIMAARIFRRRMIIHIHGGDLLMHSKISPAIHRIMRFVLYSRNPKIVLSTLEKDVLSDRFKCENVFVLPNCVDLNDSKEFKREIQPDEEIKLLFMSRISVDKGLEFILQALVKLKTGGHKFKFFMAGKGPDEDRYVKEFRSLLGEDFEFMGVVSGLKKTEILKRCNVYLLPSFYEGLPMALLESMSFALVPVTTAVGSIKFVVDDGKNGLIVNSKSSDDIVEAIERLLNDKEMLRVMGKNAQQYIINNFDPGKYIGRLNEIYKCG